MPFKSWTKLKGMIDSAHFSIGVGQSFRYFLIHQGKNMYPFSSHNFKEGFYSEGALNDSPTKKKRKKIILVIFHLKKESVNKKKRRIFLSKIKIKSPASCFHSSKFKKFEYNLFSFRIGLPSLNLLIPFVSHACFITHKKSFWSHGIWSPKLKRVT